MRDVRFGGQHVGKSDVDTEGIAVNLVAEPGLRTKPEGVVDHALPSDPRHVDIGLNDEQEPIAEIERPNKAKGPEKVSSVTNQAEVHVLGRSSTLKTKLMDKPSLQDSAISEVLEDAGKEAVEHKKLAEADDLRTGNGIPDALLQRHAKRLGRSVFMQRHSASQHRFVAAALASGSAG